MITRRDFVAGTGALALTGALLGSGLMPGLIGAAQAQTPSNEELMKAGPLGEMALGDEKAPVTIIEYASMTCSHCAHFANETFPQLKTKYIDAGKVRFIFREFPLDPLAAGGFMLARCAGKDDKSKYFAMIETLFKQQKDWVVQKPLEPLKTIAKQAGFTEESFDKCLSDQQVLDGIDWVRQRAAEKFGVNSTPTFFINGKIQRGAISFAELEKAIEPYLKG